VPAGEEVKAAVPAGEDGAPVLFIVGSATLTRPDNPVLAVDLPGDDRRQFRCVPAGRESMGRWR
jgi:hypothetical protein